jgi:hypothetical protein
MIQLRQLLVEQSILRQFRLLKESGSLPGVVSIPGNLADKVIKDFIKTIVLPSNVIDVDSITGLGSTRSILKKLPNAKKVAGDLDLLAITTTDRKSAVSTLSNTAKKLGMDYQVAFGNVFSVAYPFDGTKYQVDLMIAEASPDNEVYNYMVKFRYWSDEDVEQSTSFILKGAHRSELTRTIIKAVGLSAGESGFSEFKWNDTYNDVSKLTDILYKKADKFRDATKANETKEIADLIRGKLKDMGRLKNILADTDGLLKNRYPHSLFRNLPKGYDVLIDALFSKVASGGSWESVLDRKLGITKSVDKMRKFDDVIVLIQDLLKKKVISPRGVIYAFLEMKKNFDTGKAGMKWNTDLEKYIESKFSFLKGRW